MISANKLQELVRDLDDVICYHNKTNRLFCGGCCFAAGIIAEQLEKRNISYRVKSYREVITNDKTINDMANHDVLVHVAIEVAGVVIGDKSFNRWDDLIETYHDNISSEYLMRVYMTNTWNTWYKTCFNPLVQHDVKMVFSMI